MLKRLDLVAQNANGLAVRAGSPEAAVKLLADGWSNGYVLVKKEQG
jgi:hypothetical protein